MSCSYETIASINVKIQNFMSASLIAHADDRLNELLEYFSSIMRLTSRRDIQENVKREMVSLCIEHLDSLGKCTSPEHMRSKIRQSERMVGVFLTHVRDEHHLDVLHQALIEQSGALKTLAPQQFYWDARNTMEVASSTLKALAQKVHSYQAATAWRVKTKKEGRKLCR